MCEQYCRLYKPQLLTVVPKIPRRFLFLNIDVIQRTVSFVFDKESVIWGNFQAKLQNCLSAWLFVFLSVYFLSFWLPRPLFLFLSFTGKAGFISFSGGSRISQTWHGGEGGARQWRQSIILANVSRKLPPWIRQCLSFFALRFSSLDKRLCSPTLTWKSRKLK